VLAEPRVFLPVRASRGARAALVALGVVTMLPVLLATSLVWMPTVLSYEIRDRTLVVHARAGILSHGRSLALDRVEEAREIRLHDGTRTAGTGMPGFCAGRFSYPELGAVWQATTCTSRVVLLRARGESRPLLLSPERPAEFIEALRAGAPGVFGAPASGPAPTWWSVLLVVLAVLPFPTLALFFVAPKRLRYRVDGTTLEVRTLLRTLRFPLRGARARVCREGLGLRLFGVGLPGYSTGWFRLAGKTTRAYASAREGVLIENGRRLFVTPADIDGFLAALSQAGVAVDPAT
jgi:PH (Pleckstrin Homology) domain-containing protein